MPDNLLGPAPTLIPADPRPQDELHGGLAASTVAAMYPKSSLAWAVLAEDALDNGADVEAYAYARTGYHRGLDSLRRAGWKGHGPIPWSHEPNQGFLRALSALGRAAAGINELDEIDRIGKFLEDSDPTAAKAIEELLKQEKS